MVEIKSEEKNEENYKQKMSIKSNNVNQWNI